MNLYKSQGFVEIQSTELYVLENELTNIGSRALAYIIDTIIKWLVLFGILWISAAIDFYANKAAVIFFMLIYTLSLLYHIILESITGGKTIGKKIVGIRVIKNDGSRVSFLDCLTRNVMRAVDFLPLYYLVGIFMILSERYHRRIGDIVSGTIVIFDRTTKVGLKKYLDNRLSTIDKKDNNTILSVKNLSAQDKMLIRELHERLPHLQKKDKERLLQKFYLKFKNRIKLTDDSNGETLLKELYKRI